MLSRTVSAARSGPPLRPFHARFAARRGHTKIPVSDKNSCTHPPRLLFFEQMQTASGSPRGFVQQEYLAFAFTSARRYWFSMKRDPLFKVVGNEENFLSGRTVNLETHGRTDSAATNSANRSAYVCLG